MSRRMSRRRTNDIEGVVNFPVGYGKYRSSGEGGMFVRLVVLADSLDDIVCCGGMNNIFYDETFVGDDSPFPRTQAEIESFPGIHVPYASGEGADSIYRRHASTNLLVAMTIGSTGWSGWTDRDGGNYWTATYDSLNGIGKALYNSVKAAYPGKRIRLQTWLDT